MQLFKKKRIYMDFAAATPLHPQVMKEMLRGFNVYGNPSAPHEEAREARTLIEGARKRIARTLSVKSDDLIFTGSGTEGNNLAVHGVIEALMRRGAKPEELHIIASGFEHPSCGSAVGYWAEHGVSVSYALPNEEGIITPEAITALVRPETVLVSIVAVQSEIGQIQPLKEISRTLASYRTKRIQRGACFAPEAEFPILHTDASQSPLFLNPTPDTFGVDLATYDAQKIMGPKGVGVLYKKSWVPLEPLMYGGTQERGLRPGTENVAGIMGMAKAFELATKGRDARIEKMQAVRDYFVALVQKELPFIEINGGMKCRIANNLHISIPGTDGDYLAVLMDKEGIAVSARSACIASGTGSQSVALLGKNKSHTQGTLRFSLSPSASHADVRRAVFALTRALKFTKQF